MRVVDTKGQKCPVPIIETKKALRESKNGETFIVVTDNRTAFSNITRFLKDNKVKFTVREENGTWIFNITNETGRSQTTDPKEYCDPVSLPVPTGDFAVVISSEIMGQGDDELGRRLMKSFFTAISCLDKLPGTVVFYNSGVKLTVMDSEIIDILNELLDKGAEILICGTCVDHFNLAGRINVGTICDMYIITQKLSEAGNIIRP
jgi:selenium metabolism protein YedF